jgi:hypothetical protein
MEVNSPFMRGVATVIGHMAQPLKTLAQGTERRGGIRSSRTQ